MKNTINRPTQLIFIRHGESARNLAKKDATYFADEEARKTVRGIPDYKIPLTEEGKKQALRTGQYLLSEFGPPDYIYHSGYLRTLQTMDGILATFSDEERAKVNVG